MEVLKSLSHPLQSREKIPSMNASKVEVIGQFIIVFLMLASLVLLLTPPFESLVINFPCCSGSIKCSNSVILRFSVVYVLFLVLSAIFDLMRSFESPTHRGFWCAKVLVILSGCWASVFIQFSAFDRMWTNVLLFGAMSFIVLQIYVLVRFSYVVIIKLQRAYEGGSMWAHSMQIAFFILGVVSPVLGEILLLYFYPLCGMNIVLLITNSAIPFVACLWSMSDCVRTANGYSGFVQGGVFASFIVLYTWSALTSNAKPECNPYFEVEAITMFMKCFFVIFAHVVYVIGTFLTYEIYVQQTESSNWAVEMDDERSSSNSSRQGADIVSEEMKHVFVPKFTSFLGASMVCFVTISILNWAPLEISDYVGNYSKTALWFKLVGCWLSVLFFVVTLYTPGLYGIYPKKCILPNA